MAKTSTEQRVIAATWRFMEGRGGWDGSIELDDAICQDLMIFGVDVDDYVEELETEFGRVVWTIPWGYFTDQTSSFRGVVGCLAFLPWLVWRMLGKAFRGGVAIPRPDPQHHPNRLTLREVAAAIDAGGWPTDWQSE